MSSYKFIFDKEDYYSSRKLIRKGEYQFLYDYVSSLIDSTEESIKESISYYLKKNTVSDKDKKSKFPLYSAISYSVHDRLIQFFNITMNYFISSNAKQLNFVSSEFLTGRFLQNALFNLQLDEPYRKVVANMKDIICNDLTEIFEEESEYGPGNSGPSRFAACMIDSLATLNYPAWGYGIYYSKGFFKQKFDNGKQKDDPESYDKFLKPWYIQRNSIKYKIKFGGGSVPEKTIIAIPCDFLIPGYHTINTITLRLWSSIRDDDCNDKSIEYRDLTYLTERILPADSNDDKIKEKRFKQEYFLASATIQDILNRLKNEQNATIHEIPKYISIHMNDTQPCLMTIELLRILLDDEKMEFEEAFSIVKQVFSFTCHSIMAITFEMWPVHYFEKFLPRHLDLIYKVNDYILKTAQDQLKSEISVVEEPHDNVVKSIRMINLAFHCSHIVNGVSKMHTEMLKTTFFPQLNGNDPNKFINITNGISIRRWLHHCNKPLSNLITKSLDNDDSWPIFNTASEKNIIKFKNSRVKRPKGNYIIDPSVTERKWIRTSELLNNLIDDPQFLNEYHQIKYKSKEKLAKYIKETLGVDLDIEYSIFNVQAKEFKRQNRQTLHIFSIIYRYIELLEQFSREGRIGMQPRAYIIAGKASRDDEFLNKLIILINNAAKLINEDQRTNKWLRVVFIPDYNVTLAGKLATAADIFSQISTPDCEAAATTNMKFAINGSIILASKGGTNLELADEIGEENIKLFGLSFNEVSYFRCECISNPKLEKVFQFIEEKKLIEQIDKNGQNIEFEKFMKVFNTNDYDLVKASFEDYINEQNKLDNMHGKTSEIGIKALPHIGQLSSDRATVEYAEKIWGIKQYPVPIRYISEDD